MPRTQFLADVPIGIYRQAPELPDAEGQRPPLEDRLIAEDYAHRRDQRVAEGELAGLQTFRTERQYVVRKDAVYTLPDTDRIEAMGEGTGSGFGSGAMGGKPSEPGVARDGSNAAAGLLLRDDETGELFDIAGVTLLPDNKRQVIHCAARRGQA